MKGFAFTASSTDTRPPYEPTKYLFLYLLLADPPSVAHDHNKLHKRRKKKPSKNPEKFKNLCTNSGKNYNIFLGDIRQNPFLKKSQQITKRH